MLQFSKINNPTVKIGFFGVSQGEAEPKHHVVQFMNHFQKRHFDSWIINLTHSIELRIDKIRWKDGQN